MDPNSGKIETFENTEAANAAGYTVDLSDSQAKIMLKMAEQTRINMMKLKEERKKKQKITKKINKLDRQKLKAARKDERTRRNKNRK